MMTGVHVLLYSTNPEADRAFFHDVLEFPSVDAGGGWLIFALPPPRSRCIRPAVIRSNVMQGTTSSGRYST
jgi:hypothetical protein